MRGMKRYSARETEGLLIKRMHVYNNLEDILKISSTFITLPATILLGCMTSNLMTGLAIGKKLGNYLKIQQRNKFRKPWPEKKT